MDAHWMTHSLGRLEGIISVGHTETHRRIDDLARHLGGRISRLEAKMGKQGKTSSPWMQLAAMGLIGLSALTGLVKPEVAATILRSLLH
jgi:hypothetical protein